MHLNASQPCARCRSGRIQPPRLLSSVGAIMYKTLCVGALLMAPAATLSAQTVDYHKADLIRVAGAYVLGAEVRPVWMSDSVRFYYKSSGSKDANTYYLVDPVAKTKRVLFDHNRMAAAISVTADTVLDPTRFPTFKLVNKDATL